jgi:Rad3-related DNA helicase
MLNKLAQGIGRAIRRPEDKAVLWFADPRMPPPTALVARTLMPPHPAANPMFLSAIPERFRLRFDEEVQAAAIAVPYEGATGPSSSRRKGGRR